MIYRYSLGKNGEDRCFTDYFGIESPYPKFFYTTELNVETVKETLKEKFCKKHGMNEFTSESYISATKDSGEAQNGGERSTFFTEVSKYINDIDKKEIKEMQFKLNSKEQPDSWICLRHCSGSGSNEETFIYMPNIEYLHSCKNSDIDSDLDLYDSFMNITGDNIFRLIEEVSERPNKFSELSELKDTKPEFKLLNENLDCIDIFVYDISVVKKIKDKFDEDYEEPINEEEEEEKLAGEEEEKKEEKEENAEENSEEKEKEEKKENEEEKTAGEEELILNGQKIKKIRIVGEKLESDPTNWRYVISKGGEELIIYPDLSDKSDKSDDEVVAILLEINKDGDSKRFTYKYDRELVIKSKSYELRDFLSAFEDESKQIENAKEYIKSWEQFKSIPANIIGESNISTLVFGKELNNSMNYGKIIEQYTETSDTKSAEEKEEGSSKEEKRIEYREKEKKEREKRRTEEKKEKKLSTECIKQITDKMTEKVSNYWGELGYNFLRIAIKIMPDEAKYKNYMRIIRNNYFTDLEQFGFSDKENIKSLQKIVEGRLKIYKSSKYGRTAYGIVLIATALAYYDYCLLPKSKGNVDDALSIITKDLPKTIKNLDRTGLRNTTIAKKKCLEELKEMLDKIKEESKKMSDEIKTKLKEMSEQSETTSGK